MSIELVEWPGRNVANVVVVLLGGGSEWLGWSSAAPALDSPFASRRARGVDAGASVGELHRLTLRARVRVWTASARDGLASARPCGRRPAPPAVLSATFHVKHGAPRNALVGDPPRTVSA